MHVCLRQIAESNLNSHLTSLSKKRKQKDKAKRVREKGRCSKKGAKPRGRETSLKNNPTSLKKHLANEETARRKEGRGGYGCGGRGSFSVSPAALIP